MNFNLSKYIPFMNKKDATSNNVFTDTSFVSFNGQQIKGGLQTPDYLQTALADLKYIGFCVGLRSEEISSTKWDIQDKSGKSVECYAKELLMKPDYRNGVDFNSFCKSIVMHLDIDGNAFIVPEKDNLWASTKDIPNRLVTWNPARVRVRANTGEIVDSLYIASSKYIKDYNCFDTDTMAYLLPDQMIHIKNSSPYNNLRGIGIIQSNIPMFEAEQVQGLFEKVFFEKSPILQMIVADKEANTLPKDVPEVKRKLRSEYGYNKEPIMYLPHGYEASFPDIDYEQFKMIDEKTFSKENITMVFRIPRSYAGLETRFATKNQEQIIWEGVKATIYDKLEPIFSELVQRIEKNKNLVFRFKRNSIIDLDNIKEIVTLGIQGGFVTPRKAQEMCNIVTDNPADDNYYMPMNMIPVGAYNQVDDETLKGLKHKDGCGCHTKQDPSAFEQSTRMSNLKKLLHRYAVTTKSIKCFGIAKKYIEAETKAQCKRIQGNIYKNLNGLNTKSVSISDVFNDGAERKAMKNGATNMFRSMIAISGEQNNKFFNTKIDFSSKNPKINLVVDKLSTRYVDNCVQTRKDDIKKIISQVLTQADSIALTTEKIKELVNDSVSEYYKDFEGIEGWKADRIARTEASNAWDGSSKSVFEDLGVKSFDVVGCMDNEGYCNAQNIPMSEWDEIEFHPNHTGTRVPADDADIQDAQQSDD